MSRDEIISIAHAMAKAGMPFVLTTVDEKGQPQGRWMGGGVAHGAEDSAAPKMAAKAPMKALPDERGRDARAMRDRLREVRHSRARRLLGLSGRSAPPVVG
jgi:hypothetical protein